MEQETSSANFELVKKVLFLTEKNSKKESLLEVTQESEGDSIRVNETEGKLVYQLCVDEGNGTP